VEAHGGALTYDEAPGGGACFTVALPAAAGMAAVRRPVEFATPPPPLGRALVVDDEADLAEALAELLTDERYRVDVAASGRQARAMLKDSAYDVILSDLRMPDMDGPALYDWLEAEHPELTGRIAFVTGDTLGPSAARFLEGVNRPVLEKPFDVAGLRRVLAELRAPQEPARA
jgi:CheY-like chemotaxis protein